MELKELMQRRYSTKKFDQNIPVEDDLIYKILEITNLSASSYGLQPFKMILIKNQDIKKKLKEFSFGQENVENSSHLVIFAVRTDIDENFIERYIKLVSETRKVSIDSLLSYKNMLINYIENKSKEALFNWASSQIYIALGTFLIACASENVDACPIGGFIPEKYDEFLQLNQYGLKSVVVALAGYKHESDSYQFRAKVRKPLNEMLLEL